MPTLTDIAVRLTSDVSSWTRGIEQAEQQLTRLEQHAGKSLNYIPKVDSTHVKRGADEINRAFDQVGKKAEQTSNVISRAFKQGLGIGTGLLAMQGISLGFKGLTDAVIGTNSRLQQSEISFGVMLKSGTKAKALLAELQTLAAKTPFEFPQLVTGAQRLINAGVAANKVTGYMRSLGDVAAAAPEGMASGLQRITYALQQMLNTGKITGEEMRQLTEAGVKSWDVLARTLGVTVPKAMEMVEKRQVNSREIMDKFIATMGSDFPNMMEKQSRSFQGAMSTIRDGINMTLATAFKPMFDAMTRGAVLMGDFLSSDKVSKFAAQMGGYAAKVINLITDLADKLPPITGLFETLIKYVKQIVDWFTLLGFKLAIITDTDLSGAMGAWGGWIELLRRAWGIIVDLTDYVRDKFVAAWKIIDPIITPIINKLKTFAEPFITGFGAAIAAITAFGAAWGVVHTIVIPLVALLAGPLMAVLGALLSPIGLIAAAVGVLAVAWSKNWFDIQGKTKVAVDFIKNITAGVVDWVKDHWDDIKGIAETVWNVVVTVVKTYIEIYKTVAITVVNWIKDHWDEIKTIAKAVWDAVVTIVTTTVNILQTIISNVVDWVRDHWSQIKNIAQTTWDVVVTVVTTVVRKLYNIISDVVSWVREHWTQIESVAKSIWNGVVIVVIGIIERLTIAIMSVVNLVRDHWDQIEAVAKTVWDAVVVVALAAIKQLIDGIVSVATWVRDHWTQIEAVAKSIWDKVLSTVVDVIKGVIDAISWVVDWIKDHWDTISSVAETIWTAVGDIVAEVVNTIGDLISGVRKYWDENGEAILAAAKRVWSMIEGIIKAAAIVIGVIIYGIVLFFKEYGDEMIAAAKVIWDTIKVVVENGLKIIGGVIKVIAALINGDWSALWSGLGDIIEGAWGIIQALVEAGGKLLAIVLEALWDTVKKVAKLAWDWIADYIKQKWDEFKNYIDDKKNDLLEALKHPWSTFETFLGNLFTSLLQKFGGFIDMVNKGLAAIHMPEIRNPFGTGPTAGSVAGGPIGGAANVFPVAGYTGALQPHWGVSGVVGGTDIFAPQGTRVGAVTGGTVIEAGYTPIGGNAVTVLGNDGYVYYYAHGDRTPAVKIGQKIGTDEFLFGVGETGNAAGTGAHLHIGIGKEIQSGVGPTGGVGTGFDAITFLSGLRGTGGGVPSTNEIAGAGSLASQIVAIANRLGLPPLLLLAVAAQETGGGSVAGIDPQKINSIGAAGVWQMYNKGPQEQWLGSGGMVAGANAMASRWQQAFANAGGMEAFNANPAAFFRNFMFTGQGAGIEDFPIEAAQQVIQNVMPYAGMGVVPRVTATAGAEMETPAEMERRRAREQAKAEYDAAIARQAAVKAKKAAGEPLTPEEEAIVEAVVPEPEITIPGVGAYPTAAGTQAERIQELRRYREELTAVTRELELQKERYEALTKEQKESAGGVTAKQEIERLEARAKALRRNVDVTEEAITASRNAAGALGGFMEAMNGLAAAGERYDKMILAFEESLLTNTPAAGRAFGEMVNTAILEGEKLGVPGMRDLGTQIMAAYTEAITTGSVDAFNLVGTLVKELLEKINVTVDISGAGLQRAFDKAFALEELAQRLGSGGAAVMDALDQVLIKGTQESMDNLAKAAVSISGKLLDIPEQFRDPLQTEFMAALKDAIDNPSQETRDRLVEVLGDINTAVLMIPKNWDELPAEAQDIFKRLYDAVDDNAINAKEGAERWNAISKIIGDGFDELPPRVQEVGRSIVAGIEKGAIDGDDGVKAWQAVSKAIGDGFEDLPPIIQSVWNTLASEADRGVISWGEAAKRFTETTKLIPRNLEEMLPIIQQSWERIVAAHEYGGQFSEKQVTKLVEQLQKIPTDMVDLEPPIQEFWLWFADQTEQGVVFSTSQMNNFQRVLNALPKDFDAVRPSVAALYEDLMTRTEEGQIFTTNQLNMINSAIGMIPKSLKELTTSAWAEIDSLVDAFKHGLIGPEALAEGIANAVERGKRELANLVAATREAMILLNQALLLPAQAIPGGFGLGGPGMPGATNLAMQQGIGRLAGVTRYTGTWEGGPFETTSFTDEYLARYGGEIVQAQRDLAYLMGKEYNANVAALADAAAKVAAGGEAIKSTAPTYAAAGATIQTAGIGIDTAGRGMVTVAERQEGVVEQYADATKGFISEKGVPGFNTAVDKFGNSVTKVTGESPAEIGRKGTAGTEPLEPLSRVAQHGMQNARGLVWTGEAGSELVDFENRRVYSHEQSMKLANALGTKIPGMALGNVGVPGYLMIGGGGMGMSADYSGWQPTYYNVSDDLVRKYLEYYYTVHNVKLSAEFARDALKSSTDTGFWSWMESQANTELENSAYAAVQAKASNGAINIGPWAMAQSGGKVLDEGLLYAHQGEWVVPSADIDSKQQYGRTDFVCTPEYNEQCCDNAPSQDYYIRKSVEDTPTLGSGQYSNGDKRVYILRDDPADIDRIERQNSLRRRLHNSGKMW